jgi:hypothetical protein
MLMQSRDMMLEVWYTTFYAVTLQPYIVQYACQKPNLENDLTLCTRLKLSLKKTLDNYYSMAHDARDK